MKPYEITTDNGTILAVDHVYNGVVYTQRELSVTDMLKLGKLFATLKLPGLLDFSDVPTIKAGELINAIVEHEAHAEFLSTILTTKTGERVPNNVFMTGKAIHLIEFLQDVFVGFFSLNEKLTTRLIELFIRGLSSGVKNTARIAEQLTSSISSAADKSAKKIKSSIKHIHK